MKKWMQKLVDQLDLDWKPKGFEHETTPRLDFSEEKATLLFFLDSYSRHLIETDTNPARRVRENFDEFSKELIQADAERADKVLFRLRQYFNSTRIEEYSYVQKTFDDFRSIIWDFVDQLSEDLAFENQSDLEIKQHLEQLKESVEANSIDSLKLHSRHFIDAYTEYQTTKDRRKSARIETVRKNLNSVKKQLSEAHSTMRTDHLTKAYNRKCFEEHVKNYLNLKSLYDKNCSLISMDIDHFKKINDQYGHDMGDFILVECVRTLKEVFHHPQDIVSRVGGEEFTVLLPDHQMEHAIKKAEEALNKIRHETYVSGDLKLKFTVSMGIAELQPGETAVNWIKRADMALYESKQTGRNKYTKAPSQIKLGVAS